MSSFLSQTRRSFISRVGGYSIALQIVMIVTQTLGIDKRKLIINAVQAADLSYISEFTTTLPYFLKARRPDSTPIMRPEFLSSMEAIMISVVARSIVWVLAKSCPEPPYDDQSRQVRIDGFYKELSATQHVFSDTQIFNYRKPTRDDTRHFVPTREMGNRFVNRLSSRQKPIFPCVNRTKNISRQSALQFIDYEPGVPITSVRTVDLEVLWRKRGVKIGGMSEIREVWRLNELKPRFYFCQGGDAYESAKYIKPIVVALLESIHATKKDIRLHLPSSLQFNVHLDTVLIWDYVSFTSSLSELKFFINRLLELVPNTLTVLAFDYRFGRFHLNISEYLNQYNRLINSESLFSVERIDAELRQDIFVLSEFLSMNSGLLGTNGNIGFSMALHGQIIDSIDSNPRGGCSIGDDAMKITRDKERVMEIMMKLGYIHPEKFGELCDEGSLRFMKRRLWIDTQGLLQIDTLIAFPAFSLVDNENIGNRTTGCSTEYERLVKIIGQVANALWSLPQINHLLDEDDRKITIIYLMSVYSALHLPSKGAHRGAFLPVLGNLGLAIPPLDNACFTVPWHEVLVDQDVSGRAEIYLYYNVEVNKIPDPDTVFTWNESPFLAALEDLGIVKVEPITEVVYCSTMVNRARIKAAYNKFRRHEPKVVRVTMLQSIPPEFRSMFSVRSGFVDSSDIDML